MSQDEFNSGALPSAAPAAPLDATDGETSPEGQGVTSGDGSASPRAPDQAPYGATSAAEPSEGEPAVVAPRAVERPSRVGLVAMLLMVSGIFNVLVGALFSCGSFGALINTVGGSLLCMPVTFGTLIVGVGGALVGYRHTKNEPGLKSPLMWVLAQLFGILSCSGMAFALSLVASLILLTDEEVKAYFAPPSSGGV